MDILKNKEAVGYTTFRNAMLEKRINLLNLHELLREITNLEKNETTGKVDHPRQTTTINKETGEKVKSVGKDISDSLGGAVYNAVLSVNLDELDYLDQKILTADGLGNTYIRDMSTANSINRKFGFSVDSKGIVHLQEDKSKQEKEKEEDINAIISDEMQKLKAGASDPTIPKEVKPEDFWGSRSGMIII